MRCGRCGNENNEGNRFCGMCGAAMAGTQPAVSVGAGATPEKRAEAGNNRPFADPRVPARALNEVTAPSAPPVVRRSGASPISGPSFLGLNDPPHGPSAGHDSRGSSSSVDYLLEDDEEPRRGWGKLIAVVIALLLAGGFGYLRWKQGGFDWLLHDKRPAQSAGTSPSGADSGSTSGATASPDAGSPAATPGPTPNAATPDAGPSGAPAAPATGTGGNVAGGGDAGGQQAAPPSGGASESTPPQNPAAPSGSTAKPPEDAAAQTADSEAGDAAADTEAPAKNPKAEVSGKTKGREPKPTPATPADPTSEAARYIYGRGVRQDCDHGLRLLTRAAATSNAKAMIELGTLYSIGTCAPRDLPTAYRWFALALHKEPDNQALQDDLQKLWGQMTQPERQLAIKLSQ